MLIKPSNVAESKQFCRKESLNVNNSLPILAKPLACSSYYQGQHNHLLGLGVIYCFTQGQVGLDSFFQLIKEKKKHFVCTRVIFRKILFNDAINNEIDWLESRISPSYTLIIVIKTGLSLSANVSSLTCDGLECRSSLLTCRVSTHIKWLSHSLTLHCHVLYPSLLFGCGGHQGKTFICYLRFGNCTTGNTGVWFISVCCTCKFSQISQNEYYVLAHCLSVLQFPFVIRFHGFLLTPLLYSVQFRSTNEICGYAF